MRRRLPSAALFLPLLLVLPACGGGDGSGGAPPVLDQAYDVPVYGLASRADEEIEIAQTFTVGVAGDLTAVELLLEDFGSVGTDDVLVEIRPTIGGVPDPDDGSVLATALFDSSDLPSPPEFVRFALDADVPVQPGDVLAIVLTGVGTGFSFVWGGGDGSGYGPGAMYVRDASTAGVFEMFQRPLDPFDPADLNFRTFVAP